MGGEVILNGKKYISSKRLSKISGYTHDYISRLCREGKIVGQLIGRNWFVDKDSLDAHQKTLQNVINLDKNSSEDIVPKNPKSHDLSVEEQKTSLSQKSIAENITNRQTAPEDVWETSIFTKHGLHRDDKFPIQKTFSKKQIHKKTFIKKGNLVSSGRSRYFHNQNDEYSKVSSVYINKRHQIIIVFSMFAGTALLSLLLVFSLNFLLDKDHKTGIGKILQRTIGSLLEEKIIIEP